MTTHATNPQPYRYLRMANATLMLSVSVLILTFLVAYPYAGRFSLATQIGAHLAMPVSAGFLKLGYVMRLASQEAIQKLTKPTALA